LYGFIYVFIEILYETILNVFLSKNRRFYNYRSNYNVVLAKIQLQGALENLRSAGSSTDASKSASSTTSLTEDMMDVLASRTSNRESGAGPSLFHAVIRMIAAAEGGILDPADPEFGFGVNDALYGILINKTHRLVYTRQFGLRLVDIIA